jgi:hypothetical protein
MEMDIQGRRSFDMLQWIPGEDHRCSYNVEGCGVEGCGQYDEIVDMT